MILALMLAADVAALGGTMCAEARGLNRREVLAIGQVAINRARARRTSVASELARPDQFANGCPKRYRARFAKLARDLLAGRAKAPRWARLAVAFVAPRALRRVRARWQRHGLVPIRGTGTVHTFWRARP